MGVSGWIQHAIIIYIALSLLGLFGDTRNYTGVYGILLIILVVWWVGRRLGLIPRI
jgi:hypothetical protein